ncbi:hypothetical protein AJ79_06471 [Helicocarpus griseus UAMH5409]|uniref:Uncharacterized protein n=1 Tax=Helicocarpus griseus UAMH5409 TaxID=1447875 RepID=A0A2B7XDF1_9EURO|nr:hypothetical protein AJ79_06471 [Helicocarpus griseus UAMH5409]
MSTLAKTHAPLFTLHAEPLPPYEEREDNLPPYVEREDDQYKIQSFFSGLLRSSDGQDIDSRIARELLLAEHQRISEFVLSRSDRYTYESSIATDELSYLAVSIIRLLFRSIAASKSETISWLLSQNLVTPNTINLDGMSPLLAAVKVRSTRMIQTLIDFGAEPDVYAIAGFRQSPNGRVSIRRTPLQLAAELGNLPHVKMFIEVYKCDDSNIAPDGELALRLAAKNGHRHVVEYLPVRRGGGWERWKTSNEVAMSKASNALGSICTFLAFFVWDVPKFLLWTTPERLVVRPIVKGCSWCWENRAELLPWVKYQTRQMPVRTKRFVNSVSKGLKRAPMVILEALTSIRVFCTDFLPKHIWRICTEEIPNLLANASSWACFVLSSAAVWITGLLQRVISFAHTVFCAVISFFRALTLSDVWNGLCDILRTMFAVLPLKIRDVVVQFGNMAYRSMVGIFGWSGIVLWYIGFAMVYLIMYIPRNLWYIVGSLGASMATTYNELRVWMDPKA